VVDKNSNHQLAEHDFQVNHWEDYLKQYEIAGEEKDDFGFEWGDPDDEYDRHGNYRAVKDMLLEVLSDEKVTLEIGSLGGKWTQYLLASKKVIAMDVNNYFINYLKNKFYNCNNIEYYVGKGDELDGVLSDSVDLVFSMDTFSRVKKEYIWSYLKEISRILTGTGMAILHLPNDDLEISKKRGFTSITTEEISENARKYFSNFVVDSKTLLHGSLLIINKEKLF